MKTTQSKIYYEILTGDVIVITQECDGEDINTYEQLKYKNINEIDYIELEYGTLATTFNNVKSYKVNLKTKKLELIYYTKKELEAQAEEQEESQALADRVSAITEYVQAQEETKLSAIEDSILEIEKNKIINGGM